MCCWRYNKKNLVGNWVAAKVLQEMATGHRCMPDGGVVGKGGALRGLHPAGQDAQQILRDASQQSCCLPSTFFPWSLQSSPHPALTPPARPEGKWLGRHQNYFFTERVESKLLHFSDTNEMTSWQTFCYLDKIPHHVFLHRLNVTSFTEGQI